MTTDSKVNGTTDLGPHADAIAATKESRDAHEKFAALMRAEEAKAAGIVNNAAGDIATGIVNNAVGDAPVIDEQYVQGLRDWRMQEGEISTALLSIFERELAFALSGGRKEDIGRSETPFEASPANGTVLVNGMSRNLDICD